MRNILWAAFFVSVASAVFEFKVMATLIVVGLVAGCTTHWYLGLIVFLMPLLLIGLTNAAANGYIFSRKLFSPKTKTFYIATWIAEKLEP